MTAKKVWFKNECIFVETTDNIIEIMPLSWFKRLKNASEQDLLDFELWDDNSWIQLEKLGEDLSVDDFFTFKKEACSLIYS